LGSGNSWSIIGSLEVDAKGQAKMQGEELIQKIKELPPDKIAEVVDFVDFLAHRDDQALIQVASKTSEPAFAKVWNNADDAEYDNL
jgi:hypothetical protein